MSHVYKTTALYVFVFVFTAGLRQKNLQIFREMISLYLRMTRNSQNGVGRTERGLQCVDGAYGSYFV
jgi:hypothetical protein